MPDFVPPSPDQWQGPAKDTFTPPPVSSWQGAAKHEESPSLSGFAHNAVDSAGKFASGVGTMLAHPVDTVSNLGQTAFGALEKPVRLAGNAVTGSHTEPTDEEKKFDTLMESYKQRYGGLDKAAHTLYTDPVGSAADLATVAGGVGSLAKVGNMGRVASAASAVADTVDPMSVAGKVAGAGSKAIAPWRERMAARLYGSQLKPVPSTPVATREAMIETGLREGIPVSKSGSAKTKAAIADIDSQVADRVQQGARQGDTIDSGAVAQNLNRSRNQFANQVNPRSDSAAVDAAGQEFLEEHGGVKPAVSPQPTGLIGPNGQPLMSAGTPAVPPQPIPVDRALEIARGTKPKAYGELTGAANESQKDLKRGIKQEIYKQYPELQAMGQREKNLIDLDGALDRFIGREENKTLFSAAPALHGALSEAVAPGSGLMAAAAKQLLDKSPGLASRMAIQLANKQAKSPLRTITANTLKGAATRITPVERLSQQPVYDPLGVR